MRRGSRAKVWLFLLGILILSGCSRLSSLTVQRETATVSMQEGTEYRIYTTNREGTGLGYRSYATGTEDMTELLWELMAALAALPEELELLAALPETVTLQKLEIEQETLTLYFDAAYASMSRTEEILCRAALVKTLTQVEGIRGVVIYAGDEELKDSTGKALGVLYAADFMEEISEEGELQTQLVTLYFADEEGACLVAEQREVTVSAVTSLERAVILQLLQGPQQEGARQTLPEETELVSVIVKDEICYVNFDSTFLTESLDLNPELIIYSLVNTLTGLSDISRVQILVDGQSSVVFMNALSLENPLEAKELSGE